MTLTQAIDVAGNKAAASPCKYSVAAIAIDRKGNVLDTSRNLPRFSHKSGGIHAEMVLMKKHGMKIKSIIIFRVTKGGKLKTMDACAACAAKASDLGITIFSLI